MSTGRQGGWAWVSVWHGSAPLFNSFGLGQCFPMRVFLSSHHHILHHSLLKWFGEIIWISFDMLFNYPLKNLNIYTSLLNFFIEFCGKSAVGCPMLLTMLWIPLSHRNSQGEPFFSGSTSACRQLAHCPMAVAWAKGKRTQHSTARAHTQITK